MDEDVFLLVYSCLLHGSGVLLPVTSSRLRFESMIPINTGLGEEEFDKIDLNTVEVAKLMAIFRMASVSKYKKALSRVMQEG